MGVIDKLAKRFGYVKQPGQRSFKGANVSRLTSDWLSPTTTGDEEIRGSLVRLRGRCRELERNNDYVRRYLDGMTNPIARTVLLTLPLSKRGVFGVRQPIAHPPAK